MTHQAAVRYLDQMATALALLGESPAMASWYAKAARLVADRSPKAWAAFGALGAAVVLVVQRLAVLPLGLGTSWNLPSMFRIVLFTALWCGAIGIFSTLNLPKHWRVYRARKLR